MRRFLDDRAAAYARFNALQAEYGYPTLEVPDERE